MPSLRLLALLVLLVLPVAAAPQQADGPAGTITAAQSDQSDAEMAVRIREILRELGNYEDITVVVSEGVVTLRGTTNSLTEATALENLVGRVEGVVAIKNEVTETPDIVRRLNPAMERFGARLETLLVQLPLALIALAVFILVVVVGTRVARLEKPWNRLAPNAFIADLFRSLVRIAFVILGLVIALDILNATALLSTILGAAGLIGLAIGFAVRDTVENFIASVMLSIRQPFRPNDVVEINGDEGKVIRLTSRATILLSFDGNHVRIPNSTVFKSRIVNFSQNPERRFLFTLKLDAAADFEAVRALAVRIVQNLPFVLDMPAADAWIGDITDAGVEIKVAGWIDQRDTSIALARGEALRQVKLAIEAAGVALADRSYAIRLQGTDAALPLPQPEAAPRPRQPQSGAEVADVGAQAEQELKQLVDAERDTGTGEDLLRDDAPKE
ncbi:MAG: Small-conductance mechanosensitive channel [Rhodobacteraceae bacterium HLUCCA08]|nr:MAG: Small-conductance mechanosensitive channel [Rhodobacteraceae bacterium HLUCCA08]